MAVVVKERILADILQQSLKCRHRCVLEDPADLLICFNQPNRRLRTRTSGGEGGGSREASPYPDGRLIDAGIQYGQHF